MYHLDCKYQHIQAPVDERPKPVEFDLKKGCVWTNWVEAIRLTCEAQNVISLRLLLFASGGPGLVDEIITMISEKVDVFANAEIAATQALADGCGINIAAERAYAPLQRSVHANNLRLLRAVY